ncbi:MAG: hypothetical protein H5U40_08685, partial [Polyangiaceae bacterium]|nr:hypothetical protein [Polyangiaceae bacterium]
MEGLFEALTIGNATEMRVGSINDNAVELLARGAGAMTIRLVDSSIYLPSKIGLLAVAEQGGAAGGTLHVTLENND